MTVSEIRQEVYMRLRKRELRWWIAIVAASILLAAIFCRSEIAASIKDGFRWSETWLIGGICLIVGFSIGYSLTISLRNKKKLVRYGILAEAVVTDIKKEHDVEEDKDMFVAVYEFTLPGGENRRIKEPLNASQAGLLGLIEKGSRVPVFVDSSHPYIFYLDTHSLVRQFFRDENKIFEGIENLKKKGTDVGTIGEEILRQQEIQQRIYRSQTRWKSYRRILVAVLIAILCAAGYIFYSRF